jgi:hypothetical protein
MRKGLYQLLIGIIVLTSIIVSVGMIYYFSFKPSIESNQTTSTTTTLTATPTVTTSTTISTTQTTAITSVTTSSTLQSTTQTTSTTSTTTTSTTTTQSTTTISKPTTFSLSSSYVGQVVNISGQGNYGYGPTVMNDNGVYRMWFCGIYPGRVIGGPNDHQWDTIYYTTSTDGLHWETPIVVQSLLPWPIANQGDYGGECDPTVVKAANNLYYMYYTTVDYYHFPNHGYQGTQNAIFLAVSTDGNNWIKSAQLGYPMSNPQQPQPIIYSSTDGPDGYGIGQASAVYANEKFWLFYSVQNIMVNNQYTYNTMAVATSSDGVNFSAPQYVLDLATAPDVKYIPSLGIFFLVVGQPQNGETQEMLYWSASKDGINWSSLSNSRIIQGAPSQCSGQPGLLGYPNGTASSDLMVFYPVIGLTDTGSCSPISATSSPMSIYMSTISNIHAS